MDFYLLLHFIIHAQCTQVISLANNIISITNHDLNILELRRYHLQTYLLTQTTYWYAKERKTDKLDVPGGKKTEFWNVKSKLNLLNIELNINSEFQEDKKLNLF